MVSQKEAPENAGVENDNQPSDPNRRKLIKVASGVGLVAAMGSSAFLLGRRSTEGEAVNSPSITGIPETNSSQLQTVTTDTNPNTTVTSQETTTLASSEVASVSLEELPTSIENPQVWATKIYGLLFEVYNNDSRYLLEYVYKNGMSGNIFDSIKGDISIVNMQIQADPSRIFQLQATVVDERTNLPNLTISVDETRSFMGESFRKVVDYQLLPETTLLDTGSGSQEVTLFLINSVYVYGEYNENGVFIEQ